jgi:hypothetical protein
MKNIFGVVIGILALAAGCGSNAFQPYDTCGSPSDDCLGGTFCSQTTLPASSSFTGALCTNSCGVASDCLSIPSGFAPECVDSQCYLTCPSSAACPYGQSCLNFQDQNGNPISLCAP